MAVDKNEGKLLTIFDRLQHPKKQLDSHSTLVLVDVDETLIIENKHEEGEYAGQSVGDKNLMAS